MCFHYVLYYMLSHQAAAHQRTLTGPNATLTARDRTLQERQLEVKDHYLNNNTQEVTVSAPTGVNTWLQQTMSTIIIDEMSMDAHCCSCHQYRVWQKWCVKLVAEKCWDYHPRLEGAHTKISHLLPMLFIQSSITRILVSLLPTIKCHYTGPVAPQVYSACHPVPTLPKDSLL